MLRQYLATLAEDDFAVPLLPIGFREAWVADDEQLHRLWVLSRSIPESFGLTVAPGRFLLASIESADGIRMRAGKRGSLQTPGMSVHPDDTVWWSTWAYPGNPYRDSRGVRNRAFVIAAVDMIMLDKLHESGTHWVDNARRSDFLGGTMAWLVHVYGVVRSDLPPAVREAYETGLEKFLDRLVEWGPTGVADNMDMKALVAMAHVSVTFGDGPMVEKARAYTHRVLELVHAAGMVRDAGGVEASYNGIALYSVAHAAAIAGEPEVLDAERRMTNLKAHLTFPEPDGRNFLGPTHFNTRTSADSPNDQWSHPQRDLSIAMRHDEAMYLMHGGRIDRGPAWGAPGRQAMGKEVLAALDAFNVSLRPSDEEFGVWTAGWWSSGKSNFAYDHYEPGFYGRVRRAVARQVDPLVVPPLARPGRSFVRVFPDPADSDVKPTDKDAFVVARFPTYAAVVFTGPIGFHNYMNFAGGALSAFWTPSGGSIVLGRTGKPVDPAKSRQSWSDWRLWPTHALSGQTATGDAFSTARVGREVAEVECDADESSATITVRAPIGKQHDKSRAAQNGCLTGDVRFERTFVLGEEGVEVETRLESDSRDRVTDVCEIIPLFLYDSKLQVPTPQYPRMAVPLRVGFLVGSGWVPPAEGFVDGVSAVRVERFEGSATIVFETPQRVCLGEEWSDDYMSHVVMRNVIVDLLGKRAGPVPLPTVSIRYRIEPGKTAEPTAPRASAWRPRPSRRPDAGGGRKADGTSRSGG